MAIPLLSLLLQLRFLILMAAHFSRYQLKKVFQKLCQQRSSNPHGDHRQLHQGEDNYEVRLSPSLVPVPFMSDVVPNLMKRKLPVVEFGKYISRWVVRGGGRAEEEGSSVVCAICLSCIEGSEEIRELANCSHAYHRECLDGWVDQGHGTCPLCRLKLLPAPVEDIKGERDPWRLQRIAYLFGEDYLFENF